MRDRLLWLSRTSAGTERGKGTKGELLWLKKISEGRERQRPGDGRRGGRGTR